MNITKNKTNKYIRSSLVIILLFLKNLIEIEQRNFIGIQIVVIV